MRGIQALRRGAAWTDLSSRGRLRATGEDRARLLHAISSNVVEGLAPGRGSYAFFLNAQGRIQSDSRIFVDADHILIDCEPEARDTLRNHVESYIIMDDVVLDDITDSTCLLAVLGPESRKAVSALFGSAPNEALSFVQSARARVFRVPTGSTDGYWIEAPRPDGGRLAAELEARGAVPASEGDLEALRVARLVPRFGSDFGPNNIPHETQQMNAVSFSKGCYTGQEIVERVRSLGRVRRLLVGIELESATVPGDLAVYHDGRSVGTMTSTTPCQALGHKTRGFAIVQREAGDPGTPVETGNVPGRVLDASRV